MLQKQTGYRLRVFTAGTQEDFADCYLDIKTLNCFRRYCKFIDAFESQSQLPVYISSWYTWLLGFCIPRAIFII
jgi:hypothetical protein